MSKGDPRRRISWTAGILILLVLILALSIFFLNPSSVGNQRFVWNLNLWAVVWAINFLLILILCFILARDLIKILYEYQLQRPGSRMKAKLVSTLVTFSLLPTLIMGFLAFGLINQTLREWGSAPSTQLLESSQQITRSYYQQQRRSLLALARVVAEQLGPSLIPAQPSIRTVREGGLSALRILNREGQVVWEEGTWPEDELDAELLREARLEGEAIRLSRRTRVDHFRLAVPVGGPNGQIRGYFLGYARLPESAAFHAIQVEEAAQAYRGIQESVSQLRLNYISILFLTTLAVLAGFLWLGTYIAKKITIPLEALAEGSRELAGGNLEYRVDVKAADELGILVNSFNQMAEEIRRSRQQLEEANRELRQSNQELEERRRYIETILQNVTTGVLTLDEQGVIRTVNEAVLKMLRTSREKILNRSLREVAGPELAEDFQRMKKRARLYGIYRREVAVQRGQQQILLSATITSNPLPLRKDHPEYLIVLDDLTELIRAEKFAAWQEVARRLAHEIKNPLTPIRLSAERLRKRFSRLGPSIQPEVRREFAQVLEDATSIIISEAEILRSMVEEFSRFARLPICRPTLVDLHRLLEQTLALYDGSLQEVRVIRDLDPQVGKVEMDPEQMQRVFVNLIDNSLDALAETEGEERFIRIRTRVNPSRQSVSIEFSDNGVGIAPEDYDNLFLPYFSTKRRGTGLGLAIVRQIVSEHQGFIRAEPNQPRGTTFVIELPAELPKERPARLRQQV